MLVYLFELDSTLRSSDEISRGQAALVEEVVRNGNSVVLSFNQLVDSPGFVSALRHEESYAAIQEWFGVGAIRVSPYAGAATASEYIQRAAAKFFDESTQFQFSALDLLPENEQDRLLVKAMVRAVRYGDMERLESMRNAAVHVEAERKSEVVLRLARLILQLNLEPLSRNPIKLTGGVQLRTLLGKVVKDCIDGPWSTDTSAVQGARDLVAELLDNSDLADSQDRSAYLGALRHQHPSSDADARRVAELIIDLCYNYAVEDSIWGASKHYVRVDHESFLADFRSRLQLYMSSAEAFGHVYHSESWSSTNNLDAAPVEYAWTTTEWIMQAAKASTEELVESTDEERRTYEDSIAGARALWRRSLRKSFGVHLLSLLGFLVAFVVLNYGLSHLNARAEELDLPYLRNWLYPVVLLVVFALVASLLSRIFRVPDMLDTLTLVVGAVRGWVEVKRAPRGVAHSRREGLM